VFPLIRCSFGTHRTGLRLIGDRHGLA
jgi:hypothetical protein